MVRGLLLMAVLAAGLAVAPASASVADHNPVGTQDAAGDSNAAPDVTRVTIANTVAGELLWVIQVANRTDLVANDVVGIFVDSDQNGTTGFRNGDGGIDYLILIDGTDRVIVLLRWNGTDWEGIQTTTLEGAFQEGYVALINRSELGNTSAMSFFVETWLASTPEAAGDSVPDTVYQDYTLSSPHVETITPQWAPAAPRAGGTFRLNAVRLNFETEETGPAASFTCRATLAGKRLRGTGRGGCTFRLAKTAKGKRLVITITATPAGGKAQTFRAYTFRVR